MNRIMVPLDGSTFAEQALPYARALARRLGATVELVHVHVQQPPALDLEGLTPYGYESITRFAYAVEETPSEVERQELESMASRLSREAGVPAEARLLSGPVADALSVEADRCGAELLVMATHGRSGLDRLRHGSMGDVLARSAHRPVLLVRAGAEAAEVDIDRVLVPLDGSEFSERIFDLAGSIFDRLGGRLTLVHVAVPLADGATRSRRQHEMYYLQLLQSAESYLATVAERVGRRFTVEGTRAVVSRRPAAAILDVAARERVHMVAMTTHGRSGLLRYFLGSTADELVHEARLPVLLCGPAEQRTPAQA